MNRTAVSVIIPAYNEELAVGSQIVAVRHVLSSHGIPHEIIVVDDGSQDRTADEAIEAGARVLRQPENRGYGAALKMGIVAARHDAIVIMDADGTYPAEQIPHLVAGLETADMVVGARIGKNVHIPWVRRPGKWFLGWLASRVAGRPILDLNSGLRAFRRECAKQYFRILSNRFSFTTTATLSFLADDYRVVYHPIEYHRRVGRSKIRARHFMDFTMLVLRIAMLFQPLRVFIPLSFACGVLGVLKTLFDIVGLFERAPIWNWSLMFQPVLSTTAILLLLVGLQLLLIGMVADGLLHRIAQQSRPLAPSQAMRMAEALAGQAVREEDLLTNVKK
jgi:glycosyltransferase involved in cell wall biosynthesis